MQYVGCRVPQKRFFYISRKKRQKLPQENEKKRSFIITALMFSAMKAENGERRTGSGKRKAKNRVSTNVLSL